MVLIVGTAILVVIGVGWFVLSTVVIGTAPVDAVAESLGVMLALLIVTSVVGAILSARRHTRPTRPR